MTVKELYDRMAEQLPEELRESWDNDGLMCSPDLNAQVRRVLVALDVTEEIVDYAIENGFDLIVSHHPLIFRPVTHLVPTNPVARKLIELVGGGVSVFSFHTRADKAEGGVNDLLADIMELKDVEPFGEGGLGRIGEFAEDMSLEDFAYLLKGQLDSPTVLVADGYNRVKRVAVVGGDGKSYIPAAIAAGADTFVSGRISYNTMEEAAELGINLLEAGHYFTENPVVERFSQMLSRIDSSLEIQTLASNVIKAI